MSELKDCPFCGGAMQPRHALHVSDGNTDSIIHAAPTDCGLIDFGIGTADHGVSVAAAWNTRATPAPAVGDGNVVVPLVPGDWLDTYADETNPPCGPPESLTEERCQRWRERTRRSYRSLYAGMIAAALAVQGKRHE